MARRMRLVALLALTVPASAAGFTANIAPADKTLYLRVGDGAISRRTYCETVPAAVFFGCEWRPGWEFHSASAGSRATVSTTVPAALVGSGNAIAMSADSTDRTSHYDGFDFCNEGELYVGGFYRAPSGGGAPSTVALMVDAPPVLTNGSTGTIPISEITWSARGNASGGGDEAGPQPIPAGTFVGGIQAIASFPANVWQESCHRFFYRNSTIPPAGTYRATVRYTMTVP